MFGYGGPLVMAGLDLTHQLLATPERIADVRRHARACWRRRWPTCSRSSPATYVARHDDIAGAAVHDPCAVLALTHPELFRARAPPRRRRDVRRADPRHDRHRPPHAQGAPAAELRRAHHDRRRRRVDVIVEAIGSTPIRARCARADTVRMASIERQHDRLLPAPVGAHPALHARRATRRRRVARRRADRVPAQPGRHRPGQLPVGRRRRHRRRAPRRRSRRAARRRDDDDLPPEERARRERARETARRDHRLRHRRRRHGHRLRHRRAAVRRRAAQRLRPASCPSPGRCSTPVPTRSPTRVAYVSGRLLCIGELDGRWRVLAGGEDDEPETVTWGSADFIAAEEMDRLRGYWWSPDGTPLAVCRVDTAPVQRWHLADPADPGRATARARRTRPPARPTPTSRCTSSASTARSSTSSGTATRFPYLADVQWSEAGLIAAGAVARSARRSTCSRVDPATGATELLFEDRDDAWVELVPGVPRLAARRHARDVRRPRRRPPAARRRRAGHAARPAGARRRHRRRTGRRVHRQPDRRRHVDPRLAAGSPTAR